MILSGATQVIRAVTSAAVATDFYLTYADKNVTAVDPAQAGVKVTTAATTTLLAGSGTAGVDRRVKTLSGRNIANSGAQGVELQFFDGTNAHSICRVVLSPGEYFRLDENGTLQTFDNLGRLKTVAPVVAGITGRSVPIFKVGTAKEASGVWYSYGKDTGLPGAWAPGTPGLAGRATDGMTAADAGCLPLWTPTGNLYITEAYIHPSVAETVMIADILWVNSGTVVTTTTAQTVNSVTLPARDLDGSTNGEGVFIGILVTTATTNAAAITNMTVSYTNSDGVAGRTATLASFAATSVIGSFYIFQLATGDEGVRSIQTVTLGTSLVTGAVSFVMFRQHVLFGSALANIPSAPFLFGNPGKRLYTGSCLIPIGIAGVTTAATIQGELTVVEA